MNISFDFTKRQIKKPTPLNLVRIVGIYTAINSYFTSFISGHESLFGENFNHGYTEISSFINGLMATLLPFFGVEGIQRKTVPVEDAKVIDTSDPKIKFIFWMVAGNLFFLL